jgi:TldD protein
VRAISGEKTGFAYTDEVLLPALVEASRCGARHRRTERRPARPSTVWQRRAGSPPVPAHDPLEAVRDEEKVEWLMRIDRETRAHRSAREAGDGLARCGARGHPDRLERRELTADVRPLVRVNVSVIVEQNGRREQGYSGGGGRFGLNELMARGRLRARPRSGAAGAGEPRGGGRTGRVDDGGARRRLAGHSAA